MKKFSLALTALLLVSSCYSYKVYEPEIQETIPQESAISSNQKKELSKGKRVNRNGEMSLEKKEISKENSKTNSNQIRENNLGTVEVALDPQVIEVSPKTIIKEKGFYQLEVFEQSYKMEAVKWQGDTIVGFVKGKPKKELKFHQKDIQNLKVRQFSKARSDAFTVAAYAAGGVGIFLLLK